MNSDKFFSLFELKSGRDYIKNYVWNTQTSTDIGFALVRYYPKNKKFIPARKADGTDDTVF